MLPFNQMPSLNRNSRPFSKNNKGLSYQDIMIMKKKLSYQRKKNNNYITEHISNPEKIIIDKINPFINNTVNEATKPIIQNISLNNSFTDDIVNKLKETFINKIQTEVIDHFKNILTEHVKIVMSETMSQISSNLESLRYYEDDDEFSMYSRGSRSSRYSRRSFVPEENYEKKIYHENKNTSKINEVIVHEEPYIENIVNEEPVTENIVNEEPVTETIVNEEPLTETIVNEEPVTETIVNEEQFDEKNININSINNVLIKKIIL